MRRCDAPVPWLLPPFNGQRKSCGRLIMCSRVEFYKKEHPTLGGRESADTVRKRKLRWRERNRKAWQRNRAKQKLRYYRQFRKNTRHKGRRWTPVEDARITAEDHPTDRKLSKALGRSAQAIQQRRYLLARD